MLCPSLHCHRKVTVSASRHWRCLNPVLCSHHRSLFSFFHEQLFLWSHLGQCMVGESLMWVQNAHYYLRQVFVSCVGITSYTNVCLKVQRSHNHLWCSVRVFRTRRLPSDLVSPFPLTKSETVVLASVRRLNELPFTLMTPVLHNVCVSWGEKKNDASYSQCEHLKRA